MSAPRVSYHPDIDVLYVEFSDAPVVRTQHLDDARMIDLAADGSVVGMEFHDAVEDGINLADVPHADLLRQAVGATLPRIAFHTKPIAPRQRVVTTRQ